MCPLFLGGFCHIEPIAPLVVFCLSQTHRMFVTLTHEYDVCSPTYRMFVVPPPSPHNTMLFVSPVRGRRSCVQRGGQTTCETVIYETNKTLLTCGILLYIYTINSGALHAPSFQGTFAHHGPTAPLVVVPSYPHTECLPSYTQDGRLPPPCICCLSSPIHIGCSSPSHI